MVESTNDRPVVTLPRRGDTADLGEKEGAYREAEAHVNLFTSRLIQVLGEVEADDDEFVYKEELNALANFITEKVPEEHRGLVELRRGELPVEVKPIYYDSVVISAAREIDVIKPGVLDEVVELHRARVVLDLARCLYYSEIRELDDCSE